ncbi:putative ankyrin repeat protein [Lachnellula willkommii]|uniref:Putative ankyrin repeat protein n=1 Tax=Lachnellula willkommii TaxID=215461 RepID=A0A559MGC4_9HELO|nr:putative ankyrin repeat protein [Lachnellula willkommii]
MDDNFGVISPGTTDTESWPTRLSRTRVSSVQTLSLSDSPDTVARTLEDVLCTVQQLGLKRYPFDSIESQDRVGEGESFCVDRCLHNRKVVAVKHIKLESLQPDDNAFNKRLRTVLNEIRIMQHTPLRDHPNTLSVLGYGWRTTGQTLLPYIVVEYGDHGSLRKYLSESPRSFKTKIILAGDVAAGITALHQCDIIHGDLKLDNCVVMQSWERPSATIAKICDFGHSIILAGDKKHLKYYGTAMYNSPEVETQDKYPLSAESFVKCDVWAYALTLWEILDNGNTYFKKDWRDYRPYAKSWPISLTSADQDTLIKEESPTPLDDDRHIFGTFDSKYLCALGKNFINSLYFGSAFADKACLRLFIHRALQADPLLRPSKIQLGPIMTKWNPSDINALHAKLAINTGTSEWTFDVLKPDQDKEILWDHQRQIFQDFEKIATLPKPGTESPAAAFQVAMCYLVGFGTCKNVSSAMEFLKVAEDLGHVAAKLFGPQLQSVITSDPSLSNSSYNSKVVRGLEVQPPNEAITLTFQPSSNDSPPYYESSQEDTPESSLSSHSPTGSSFFEVPLQDIMPSVVFQTYEELKQWVHASALDEENYRQCETAVLITPSSKMTILECAMLFRDSATVKLVLQRHPELINKRHLRDPLFVTACRTTNIGLVELLLQSGLDPFAADDDGDTLFHWLFMLGEEVGSLLPVLKRAIGAKYDFLDTPCRVTKTINPQWPLRLKGTPLAFAVSTGSIAAIKALLDLGANPTAPIQEPSESDDGTACWTPVHLSIKYHSLPMLYLLIASIETRRSSFFFVNTVKTAFSGAFSMSNRDEPLKSQTASAFQHLMNSSESPDTWQSVVGCILSFSSPVERMAVNGNNHESYLAKIIELLPTSCFTTPSKQGSMALMQAIDFHDISVATALLAAYPELAETPFRDPLDGKFIYPIHFASQIASHRDANDALDIVKALMRLDSKQSSVRDSQGRTPLHFAVTGSSDRATKWLIENGGSVNAITSDAWQTPLHVIRLTSSMNLLLDAGADIDQQDKLGCTLGHIAALAGQEHLVKAVIDRRAKIHIKDNAGRTMLHCAVTKRSPSIVSMLLKAGLDINAKTLEGNTPLHLAVQLYRSDILRLLIEQGADMSVRNGLDFTPLHRCVFTGDEITLRPLLDLIKARKPSLIQARDSKYRTPLHIAATLARSSAAAHLLSYGADPGSTEEDGNTPLHLVIASSDEDIQRSQGDRIEFCKSTCEYISTQNPESSPAPELLIKNKNGSTPWDLAYSGNHLLLVEIIFQYGGLEACCQFWYRGEYVGEYVGSLLLDAAVRAEAWDLVVLLLGLLSYEETAKRYRALSVEDLRVAVRMGDKMGVKQFLQMGVGIKVFDI